MKVTVRRTPHEIDQAVRDRVTKDVTDALNAVTTVGGRFVVNDTPWFEVVQGKLKARVANTAEFVSQSFEDFLTAHRGWARQRILEGQKIDGYLEADHPSGYVTNKAALFGFLDQYTDENPEEAPDTTSVRLYQAYVERSFFAIQTFASKYHAHFTKATAAAKFRVGLEFETGNVASSFRSLAKLSLLYRRGNIDAGVFVTAIDKANSAARIWPAANRNGSFEELDARGYRDAVFFPIWEVGFAPDRFDRTAPYLGPDKTTYAMQNLSKIERHGRHDYEVWTDGRRELLRRV